MAQQPKEWLDTHRHNVREWVQSGFVKSIKFYSIEEPDTCAHCASLHGRIFDLSDDNEVRELMNADWIKQCTNELCRCYVRPEDISID